MNEWRPVVGFEKQYEVSEEGVRRLRDKKMMALSGGQGRYLSVILSKNGCSGTRSFHVILAEAFLGPRPDGAHVCHRDDNRLNNKISNLYYGTPAQNAQDAIRNGKHSNTNKTHCPWGHLLEPPNLASWELSRGQRKCLACRNSKNTLRARPHLDRKAVADAYYDELLNGTPNPYRRTVGEAHKERVAEGTHHMTARTHCPRGHRLLPSNLRQDSLLKGIRSCLSCDRARGHIRNHGGDLKEISDRYYLKLNMGAPWQF